MAVSFSELTGSASNADANSYTTASVTLTAGNLYLVGVGIDKTAGVALTTVATTGAAISFTLLGVNAVGHKIFDTSNDVSIWWVVPGSTVTDTIVISLASAIGADWSVIQATGATATPIVQSIAASSNSAASITVTLTNNLVAGNARFTYGASSLSTTLAATSGTWSQGTTRNRSTPAASGRAAWNATPATTDKAVIWTPGTTGGIAGVIVEIAASTGDTEFVGAIPL